MSQEPPVFSQRENEIVAEILAGKSNKIIARDLRITEATVKVHLKKIFRRAHVKNRTQLAILVHKKVKSNDHGRGEIILAQEAEDEVARIEETDLNGTSRHSPLCLCTATLSREAEAALSSALAVIRETQVVLDGLGERIAQVLQGTRHKQ